MYGRLVGGIINIMLEANTSIIKKKYELCLIKLLKKILNKPWEKIRYC